MIIHDLVGTEDHQAYKILEAQNLVRQYDFAYSLFQAASALGQIGLSHDKLRALNFHGIACLHKHAGTYRPHNVVITQTTHKPPALEQVPPLMDAFVGEVNQAWGKLDPIELAAFVLWRLNWIHPFVNGNGRTARVAAYYTICRSYNLWLPGTTPLPELIRQDRAPYYAALKAADAFWLQGVLDVSQLRTYLGDLLERQLASAQLAP